MLGVGHSIMTAAALCRRSPVGALVDLSFGQDRYLSGGALKTFDDLFDYSATGLATFHNAAGDLVWNAHNLLSRSNDFTAWGVGGNLTITPNAALGPDGYMSATRVAVTNMPLTDLEYLHKSAVANDLHRKAIWARTVSGTGTVAMLSHHDAAGAVVALTEEWQLITLDTNTAETGGTNFYAVDFRAGTLTEVLVWGGHMYRNDLGGMADNPDNALGAGFETYVPTGATPVYKARRNAYVNGVKAGLRFESEARTNLLRYSEQLLTWPSPESDLLDAGDGFVRIVTSGSSGFGRLERGDVGGGSGTYTLHLEARSGNSGVILMRAFGTGFDIDESHNSCVYKFNFEGANFERISGNAAAPPIARLVAPGVYHLSMTFTATSVSHVNIYPVWNNNTPGMSVDVRRLQLEMGATPTSYIPTAGSAVTRPAETLRVRAASLPSVMPAAVSFAMEGHMTYADEGTFNTNNPMNWQLSTANRIRYEFSTNAGQTGHMYFVNRIADNQTPSQEPQTDLLPGVDVPFSYASRHTATEIQGASNGGALTVGTHGGLPDLIGAPIHLGYNVNGYISRFRMWNRDIGESGIVEHSA